MNNGILHLLHCDKTSSLRQHITKKLQHNLFIPANIGNNCGKPQHVADAYIVNLLGNFNIFINNQNHILQALLLLFINYCFVYFCVVNCVYL